VFLLKTLFIRSALERMGATKRPVPFQSRLRMKLHRNARTTPLSRRQLVERVLTRQWTYREAAEGGGISRRTVAKWVQRFRTAGLAGLENASSRPHPMPAITAAAMVRRIRRLRERHGLPAWAISHAVGVPRPPSVPGCGDWASIVTRQRRRYRYNAMNGRGR
jgi:transposase-like protein